MSCVSGDVRLTAGIELGVNLNHLRVVLDLLVGLGWLTNTMSFGRPFSFNHYLYALCGVDFAINQLLCDWFNNCIIVFTSGI